MKVLASTLHQFSFELKLCNKPNLEIISDIIIWILNSSPPIGKS